MPYVHESSHEFFSTTKFSVHCSDPSSKLQRPPSHHVPAAAIPSGMQPPPAGNLGLVAVGSVESTTNRQRALRRITTSPRLRTRRIQRQVRKTICLRIQLAINVPEPVVRRCSRHKRILSPSAMDGPHNRSHSGSICSVSQGRCAIEP